MCCCRKETHWTDWKGQGRTSVYRQRFWCTYKSINGKRNNTVTPWTFWTGLYKIIIPERQARKITSADRIQVKWRIHNSCRKKQYSEWQVIFKACRKIGYMATHTAYNRLACTDTHRWRNSSRQNCWGGMYNCISKQSRKGFKPCTGWLLPCKVRQKAVRS